mmetsp:Transcript_38563/g.110748  ORF Transcript_38563/g.110748 Transcript_38563/m.110748 type:complete len:281 (+) Transcript_38563:312-1154(+)
MFLLPNVFTQMAMWRSPASLLKVLPQCGHLRLFDDSAPPMSANCLPISAAFACASASPSAALAAKMACRKARDFFRHSGTASPFLLSLAGAFSTLSRSFSSFLAFAMRASAFSSSPRRFAALSKAFRFCWKTFLHTFTCFSSRASLKFRPHSGQGTSGPSSSSSIGIPPAGKAPGGKAPGPKAFGGPRPPIAAAGPPPRCCGDGCAGGAGYPASLVRPSAPVVVGECIGMGCCDRSSCTAAGGSQVMPTLPPPARGEVCNGFGLAALPAPTAATRSNRPR